MFETGAESPNRLAVVKARKPARLYTLDEYLRMESRSNDKHEYLNGKIVKIPYSRFPHNLISGNIITKLNNEIEAIGKPYLVLTSDQQIFLPKLNYGLYADAITVCEKPKFWYDNNLLLVNPTLIVEILSKSTAKYDRAGKFDEYKTLPSFQEYVLVRQDAYSVETRFREEPGLWRETLMTDLEGSVFLRSIGCSVLLKSIYRNVEL